MASVDDNEPVAADAPATEEMDTSCTVGRPGRLNPLRSSKVSPVAERDDDIDIDVEPPRIPPFEIEDDTLEKELELVTKRKKRKKWIVLGAAVALILVVVLVLGAVVGIIIATWPVSDFPTHSLAHSHDDPHVAMMIPTHSLAHSHVPPPLR
tara:strand:+ start:478 stop:933 length:456 start_codon:yes stop_codon:yes gene_type:complete